MSARETAIEAMAKAQWENSTPAAEGWEWESTTEIDRQEWRADAAVALNALLAARSEEPCPTCGGSGTVSSGPKYRAQVVCPGCKGSGGTGTRPLLAALIADTENRTSEGTPSIGETQ